MLTKITLYIVHDNPEAIEHLKKLYVKMAVGTLNIERKDISVNHENK